MDVTKDDLRLVKSVVDRFSKNLLFLNPEAIDVFAKHIGPKDYFNITAAKLALNVPTFSVKTRVKRELKHCCASLPPLKKAFGEAALIEALPVLATSDRAIQLCDHLGVKDVADLCRKKKKQASL